MSLAKPLSLSGPQLRLVYSDSSRLGFRYAALLNHLDVRVILGDKVDREGSISVGVEPTTANMG
jgi:hypothetical protein